MDVEKIKETLMKNIKERRREIEELVQEMESRRGYFEYKFHTQSFKIYDAQEYTLDGVKILKNLLPDTPFSPFFETIINEGTHKEFNLYHNVRWLYENRPILEAFYHVKGALETALKGQLEENVPFGEVWDIAWLYGIWS